MTLFRLATTLVSLSLVTVSCKSVAPVQSPSTTSHTLPAGLIYSTVAPENFPVFWLSGKDGAATQLADLYEYRYPFPGFPTMDFFVDGTLAVTTQISGTPQAYGQFNFERGDIVMRDTKTGKNTQLTHDPTHINWFPQWWPGNTRTIIFMASQPGTRTNATSGSLGMVNADGSDYRVYEDIPFNKVVASTDGKAVLHMLKSDPTHLHLLTRGGETRVIDPALFPGFKLVETKPESDPSSCLMVDGLLGKGNWSPDVSLVSWRVCLDAITFLNLQDPTKTFSITRSIPAAIGTSTQLPIWSSDSQYFALIGSSTHSMNGPIAPPTDSNIQIFDRTGKLQHQIDYPNDLVTSLHWRPGTHEFIYTLMSPSRMVVLPSPAVGATPVPAQPDAILFNLDTRTTVNINLPSPIGVLGWVVVP